MILLFIFTRDEPTHPCVSCIACLSGFVEIRELRNIFKDMSMDISIKEITKLQKKFDTDGSGKIDIVEFLSMCRSAMASLYQVVEKRGVISHTADVQVRHHTGY